MTFEEMGLPAPLLKAIEELGFEAPTAIQAQALPVLLDGRDLAGQSKTGTGKTACFLLAIMTDLLDTPRPEDGRPRALIVAPTRELADQIGADAVQLAVHTDLETALAYGGTNWEKQANDIRKGADIVAGTPGRLIDYYKRGVLKLDRIEYVVIDEADRMFDMGFVDDLVYLFRRVPPKHKRRSLLFSATLNRRVMALAWRHMTDPVEIGIEAEDLLVDKVDHELYHVGAHEKVSLLLGLLEREKPHRSMIFVNRKVDGEYLCWRLNGNGHPAVYISGDLPQRQRTRIIEAFKEGKISTLVATDVASRGIHVDDVSHVFNYDVPQDPEDYVHRVGRTARAGATGRAITLACDNYVTALPAIETYLGEPIPVGYPDDDWFLPDRSRRFIRRRGKPYSGWPPEGEKRGDGGGRSGGGEGGGRKRRRRRSKRGGGPTDAPAKASSQPKKTDDNGARPEKPASEAGGNGKSPRRGRADRRRQRRRIGDGEGLNA